MSHWDSKAQRIVRWPSVSYAAQPEWIIFDCGCCQGIEWGGETPVECDRCKGASILAVHEPTRTLALYPGGPLMGRMSRADLKQVLPVPTEFDFSAAITRLTAKR